MKHSPHWLPHFPQPAMQSALVKMKRGGKHPTIYAIRSSSVQQVLYRKAERLGTALPNGLGHVWIGCRVQTFVNPAAEAFGSLLTAWPVLLAVFFIAPELANIASHHRSVQTSNLLVSSGVPRTPVTNKTCGHTFQKDGLSSLVRFLTNTRLDSKLGKFSKSETLPNANC